MSSLDAKLAELLTGCGTVPQLCTQASAIQKAIKGAFVDYHRRRREAPTSLLDPLELPPTKRILTLTSILGVQVAASEIRRFCEGLRPVPAAPDVHPVLWTYTVHLRERILSLVGSASTESEQKLLPTKGWVMSMLRGWRADLEDFYRRSASTVHRDDDDAGDKTFIVSDLLLAMYWRWTRWLWLPDAGGILSDLATFGQALMNYHLPASVPHPRGRITYELRLNLLLSFLALQPVGVNGQLAVRSSKVRGVWIDTLCAFHSETRAYLYMAQLLVFYCSGSAATAYSQAPMDAFILTAPRSARKVLAGLWNIFLYTLPLTYEAVVGTDANGDADADTPQLVFDSEVRSAVEQCRHRLRALYVELEVDSTESEDDDHSPGVRRSPILLLDGMDLPSTTGSASHYKLFRMTTSGGSTPITIAGAPGRDAFANAKPDSSTSDAAAKRSLFSGVETVASASVAKLMHAIDGSLTADVDPLRPVCIVILAETLSVLLKVWVQLERCLVRAEKPIASQRSPLQLGFCVTSRLSAAELAKIPSAEDITSHVKPEHEPSRLLSAVRSGVRLFKKPENADDKASAASDSGSEAPAKRTDGWWRKGLEVFSRSRSSSVEDAGVSDAEKKWREVSTALAAPLVERGTVVDAMVAEYCNRSRCGDARPGAPTKSGLRRCRSENDLSFLGGNGTALHARDVQRSRQFDAKRSEIEGRLYTLWQRQWATLLQNSYTSIRRPPPPSHPSTTSTSLSRRSRPEPMGDVMVATTAKSSLPSTSTTMSPAARHFISQYRRCRGTERPGSGHGHGGAYVASTGFEHLSASAGTERLRTAAAAVLTDATTPVVARPMQDADENGANALRGGEAGMVVHGGGGLNPAFAARVEYLLAAERNALQQQQQQRQQRRAPTAMSPLCHTLYDGLVDGGGAQPDSETPRLPPPRPVSPAETALQPPAQSMAEQSPGRRSFADAFQDVDASVFVIVDEDLM